MATPRRLLVNPTVSGVFHCISRCVRRAFLCGLDRYSGKDFEHRRSWVRDRLQELAGLFAIEVHSYSVMSNHLHVVVRTLPELVATWSDEEVARRWLSLFTGRGAKGDKPADPPSESAILALCRDAEKLATCRARLADLSWFMRCLNEPIARRANLEDNCTGRFWEGRFKCQKLDDEAAALACMAYVDLNPVRAGIAPTPEQSDFTSAQDRIAASQARQKLAAAPENPTPDQAELIKQVIAEASRDQWLAPIGALPTANASPGQPAFQSAIESPPSLLTNLTAEDYLELLDWTGRQIRADKRGHLSPNLRPILERLDLDVEAWVNNVERYGGLFHRVAGKLKGLKEFAAATGRAWLQGQRGARQLYAEAA